MTTPWTTLGTNILYDAGKVGIGSTNPTSKFHVIGEIRFDGETYNTYFNYTTNQNTYIRPENGSDRSREYSQGAFAITSKQDLGYLRLIPNSVGEGAIWVTNYNGILESGDYITTSKIPGWGMKQDDDIMRNYTEAKITMDCDFDPKIKTLEKNETSGDVSNRNQIKLRLPLNSLIDLSSFGVHASMTTSPTIGFNGTDKVGYYPCRDLYIIRRLTVEISNNNVCTIDNYDRIRSMMLDYSMNESKKNTICSVMPTLSLSLIQPAQSKA
ncbi:hypothetical protein T484DRAFT_3636481 [Baffinella frigidus]|nr:hypothetical protein T484DRAFT_3636481 [Cryptophyta sp. CCMP2293]